MNYLNYLVINGVIISFMSQLISMKNGNEFSVFQRSSSPPQGTAWVITGGGGGVTSDVLPLGAPRKVGVRPVKVGI